MAETVLILGYGRAGRRQAALAKQFGATVYIYDPAGYRKRSDLHIIQPYPCPEVAYADAAAYDHIVICTPPELHLEQIEACLFAGARSILCEKPLCGLGQLDQAKALPLDAPVMVAYNYRYHPRLVAARGQVDSFQMNCAQQRTDLPYWGLLLDHCSHDLDIMRQLVSGKLAIQYAESNVVDAPFKSYGWRIGTNYGPISEMVTSRPVDREALIRYPYPAVVARQTQIDIDPDPRMFAGMWRAFLEGDYNGSLAGAIETQELLQKCYQLDEEVNYGD